MKYILILLLLCSTLMHAEYLRTIRIASFATKAESQESLREIKKFISLHQSVIDLQKEWNFEFKARRSGKYYITLVEPFTQRKILQEVIDVLRLNYKDVYVTSIKKRILEPKIEAILEVPLSFDEDPEEIDIGFEEEILEVKQLQINQDELQEAQVEPEKENTVNIFEEEVDLEEVKKNEEVKKIEDKISNENYWQVFSFILFLSLIYLLFKIFKYKKEKEIHLDSVIINQEKFNQLNLEMKDREKYLSHASHELRAPMTAIMGLTHLVLEADLQKQEETYIRQIESSATNLLNIVNDILDVSKIKAGELNIEKVEFNINHILEYVLNIIALQAKNNNINCLVDIDKEVPSHIIGDSLRLGQVLINLLGNAVKFTKDGEVSLSVKKVASSGDVVRLEFVVSDEGVGMTADQLEYIFQSFTQADESTSRKFGGTGLGLSISQELVRMMQGEIKVKSEPGRGTTFSFEIAFKLKDHLNKRQYRLPSVKLMNKRILVIDSSGINGMRLIQMLGYFKYRTHVIPSFEEIALEEDLTFDIVIINKNHLSTLIISKLLSMQKEQGFKVVILSELYSSLNNKILENLEVDSYLQTSFNQQNILDMIIDLYTPKKLGNKERSEKVKNILQGIVDKKILIAEDNEVNHKVISGLLAQTGIEITYVINGQEAIDILLSGKVFDLVLMDISMPIMDGFEATKEIRKHKEFDTLPILALTADVMDESIEKTSSVGMQGHISKPIIIDIFYKKIYDALSSPKKKAIETTLPIVENEGLYSEYEEIAISVGLERYKNDKEFYHSILKDFKKVYINSPLDLEESCRMGDFKTARHKAMDIKDVALSIGAYKLCENAATMEYSLEKGSRSNWLKLISFYEEELEKLFKDIDKYLKANHI